jgi:hypothetical protein
MYVYLFFSFFSRRGKILRTTNDIAEELEGLMEQEELEESDDDDVQDKDYMQSEDDSDTSDEEAEDRRQKAEKARMAHMHLLEMNRNRRGREIRVYMDPPEPDRNRETDQDSDDSDEPSGDIGHLPKALLRGTAEKKVRTRKRKKAGDELEDESSDDEDDAAVQVSSAPWTKRDPGLVGKEIPEHPEIILPDNVVAALAAFDAYDYYKLFQPDEFVEMAVEESKLYAGQKDLHKAGELVNMDTYRCTEAVLLMSGYHKVPRRRMMWEKKGDCFNPLVAKSIRRKQMEAVLSCLHFRDNAKEDKDSYYKVQLQLSKILGQIVKLLKMKGIGSQDLNYFFPVNSLCKLVANLAFIL